MSNLDGKIARAIKIIQMAAGNDTIEVCYSGGKDSDVILELTKMAGVKYRAIYKQTSIDPPGTTKYCQSKGVEVVHPKKTFLQIVRSHGTPTRRARFCCSILKEYKILDTAIQGIRRCESAKRQANYSVSDPIVCRIYGKKENHVSVALPILDWTDMDVIEFIESRQIKCHPLYYDESGKFHVERRLGCIGCPLQSDNGKSDYLRYPKLLKLVAKNLSVWMQEHPNVKSCKKFGDPFGLLAHNLFFDSYEDWKAVDTGLFGRPDWKKSLENYFKINL